MNPHSNPSSSEANAGVEPGDANSNRIDVPDLNDVLCGRGGSINSHKGNERFRDLVEKRKRVYLTARFKREKRLIASSIVSEIRNLDPPGRFLARKGDKDHGYWYDIGDEKARDKTSQALRENAPSIRAEIETEINQQRDEEKQDESSVQQKPPPTLESASHPYYSQQSYWDWYHHYYGYPPPAPHHYASHQSQPAAQPPAHPPAQAPAQPAQGYWGHTAPPSPQKSSDGFRDHRVAGSLSQEAADHLMAMELQHEERAEAYEARKQRQQNSRSAMSSAFLRLGSSAPTHMNTQPQARSCPPKKPSASPFQANNAAELTQEERDHRLAVALQEKEDNVLRHQLQAGGDSSRRTSRSNAYSQVSRVNRDTNMSSHDSSNSYSTLEQMVPSSFVAWVTSDTGANPKPPERQRSVQFKEVSQPDMGYPPAGLQRESSVASAETRPLQPQTEPNPSLLSQVATHILGSWENPSSAGPSEVVPGAMDSKPLAVMGDEPMQMGGREEILPDARDEMSMPPPEPRVQIDWPSRVGSCHAWIPETLGAAWVGATHTSRSSHNHIQNTGISPVNSLEMDGSAMTEPGSVGGGSLCHVFEHDDSLMQRALREVPSWERSMRSKSPLSITSMDGEDTSMIRIHDVKPPRSQTSLRDTSNTDMDWEEHPTDG